MTKTPAAVACRQILIALLVLSPSWALAQTRGVSALSPDVGSISLTPFIGAVFSGDLKNSSSEFGVALGYGANERISLEAEVGFAPGPSQGTLIVFDTKVWTANGNVVYHFLHNDFTPYATVGLGVLGSNPDIANSLLPATDNSTTTFAFNWGGGIKAALNDRVGLRVDLRNFNARELAPDHWRVYAGVVLRRIGK
jgi:hypothetical protein